MEIARFKHADANSIKAGINVTGMRATGGGETMAQTNPIVARPLMTPEVIVSLPAYVPTIFVISDYTVPDKSPYALLPDGYCTAEALG